MTESEDKSNLGNAFDSIDFNKFLEHKVNQPNDSENSILGTNELSAFKSNESVGTFLSREWDTKRSSSKSLQGRHGILDLIEKVTKSEGGSNRNNDFDSVDFNHFLHQKVLRSNDSLNDILRSSDFKSKDSFISRFLSKDSQKNLSCNKFLDVCSDEKPWKAAENPNAIKATATFTSGQISKHDNRTIQKSQDWIELNTLGKYVEIPYSMGMFSSTVGHKKQTGASLSIPSSPSTRTNFNAPLTMNVQEKPVVESSESNVVYVGNVTKKKKRNRAPRKKIIPKNKKYLEPTEKDVLMGRGGKSNHHPGNMRYRAEIDRLQEDYKETDDKDEKTNISETLVLHVQSYGGNFLEKDDDGWYVIDDVVARRKVSQALREDKDPEKRRAKRQRFLTRRARLEKDARRKEG
jgi:hypothetical protein